MATQRGASRVVILALFVATFAVYADVRTHEFIHYDDDTSIVNNPMLRSPLDSRSLNLALRPYHANWIPLTWLSLQLDAAAFGIRAPAFLLVNVTLHALAAAALFGALFRMTGSLLPSAFCAMVFAVHPLHVESVAWAAERKDVLSGLLWTLTLYVYARYVERPGSVGRYLAVTVSLTLGLLAKPMGVTLPFALLLLDYWPFCRFASRNRPRAAKASRILVEKLPWMALSLAVASVTLSVQRESGAMNFGEELPLTARLANSVESYVSYLSASFWPMKLSFFYPFPKIRSTPEILGNFAILLILSFAAVRLARSRPYLLVGWLWFLGTLVPVIGFVQVGLQSRADRYMYIPLIGIAVAVAWGGAEWGRRSAGRKTAVIACASAALIALALTARDQVSVWRDSATLFEHALLVTQDNHIAHHQLGSQRLRERRISEAERNFREAIRIAPDFALAQVGLAEALYRQGRAEEALAHYSRGLELEPGRADLRVKMGLVLLGAERDAEAREAFERSLAWFTGAGAHDPSAAVAHFGLAEIEERSGDVHAAIDRYRRGLSLAPTQFQGQIRLARALLRAGDLEAAERSARAAATGLSLAQTAELARFFDGLSSSFGEIGAADRANDAARAGLELARAAGLTELAEQLESRIRELQSGSGSVAAPDEHSD